MHRKTFYPVGRGAKFSAADFDKLSASIPILSRGWNMPTEYEGSRKGWGGEPQQFNVRRKDGRPLIKAEVEALYWFYLGYMHAHGIVPVDAIATLQ